MIKDWKLFLESNSRDQEILDNIKDILVSLKVDHSIRVFIRDKSIPFEFGKVRVTFIVEGEIKLDEVQTISHLDSYLRSEEFDPCNSGWAKSNKINELDVVVQRKSGKLGQYAISKLIAMLNGVNKDVIDLTRIEFEYYLPDYLAGDALKELTKFPRYRKFPDNGNIFKIGELIKL